MIIFILFRVGKSCTLTVQKHISTSVSISESHNQLVNSKYYTCVVSCCSAVVVSLLQVVLLLISFKTFLALLSGRLPSALRFFTTLEVTSFDPTTGNDKTNVK